MTNEDLKQRLKKVKSSQELWDLYEQAIEEAANEAILETFEEIAANPKKKKD